MSKMKSNFCSGMLEKGTISLDLLPVVIFLFVYVECVIDVLPDQSRFDKCFG